MCYSSIVFPLNKFRKKASREVYKSHQDVQGDLFFYLSTAWETNTLQFLNEEIWRTLLKEELFNVWRFLHPYSTLQSFFLVFLAEQVNSVQEKCTCFLSSAIVLFMKQITCFSARCTRFHWNMFTILRCPNRTENLFDRRKYFTRFSFLNDLLSFFILYWVINNKDTEKVRGERQRNDKKVSTWGLVILKSLSKTCIVCCIIVCYLVLH